jgi:hypothetical protein
VQQERRPPQRVPADMEQPPDQSGVNGHLEVRIGGLVFSGLAATSFPGWWPRVLPAGWG